MSLAFLQSTESAKASSSANDRAAATGAVYTASNSSNGNEVFAFSRSRGGDLRFTQAFPSGGLGNDAGLGSQGGVILSDDGRWLLVVNPGSNDISVFRVAQNGALSLTETESSNGELPISITMHGNLVYVLNGGGDGNISGYTLDTSGHLTALEGSIQPLSGMEAPAPAPAQIQFRPGGTHLVVTEKATNLIDIYELGQDGVAGAPVSHASAGETPFGFDFSSDGYLIISEAFGGGEDLGTVSNYVLNGSGELSAVDTLMPTTETAPCWIVTTDSGRYAYTTNTGSGSITGFRVGRAGALTPLDPDGVTAETGADSGPIDEALSAQSHYLYVLNSLTHEILGFQVRQFNGSLLPASSVGALPEFAFGLAAR